MKIKLLVIILINILLLKNLISQPARYTWCRDNTKQLIDESDLNRLTKSLITKKKKTLAAKNVLKAEQDKILKLQVFDSSYFRAKNLFRDKGFPDMFVYQLTSSMLKTKYDKLTENVINWKS